MNGRDGQLLDLEQAEYDALSPAKKDYYQQFRAFMPDIDFPVNTLIDHNNQTNNNMSTIAVASTPRKLLSADTHVARCVWVIDLGTHTQEFKGVKKTHPKVLLGFEVPGETIEIDGVEKPMFASKKYTLSLFDQATLAIDLASWRGKKFSEEEAKGFQIANLLGVPCMLTIQHSEYQSKTYANIATITRLHKDLKCPEQVNPSLHYEIEMNQGGTFEQLAPWVKKVVQESAEFNSDGITQEFAETEHAEAVTDDSDGLPF